MPEPLAVLTGDIVGSTRLAPAELDAALDALRRAADDAAGWGGRPARFTRFRGDGWQCVAPSPELSLRTALYLWASLRAQGRALDSRIAIGIGPGEVPQDGDLSAASGPAFRLAGRGLDAMARPARLAIAWADPPAGAERIAVIAGLADEIARRWTSAQAAVLCHLLPPGERTQSAVAKALGISQQMVAKHRQAAGDWALERALHSIEAGW